MERLRAFLSLELLNLMMGLFIIFYAHAIPC